MPLPPVVVEITPPEAQIRETAALLDACSEAVVHGECVLGDVSRRTGSRRAIATVEWRDERLARIEVAAGNDGENRRVRDLSFRPEDDIDERWTTVGFAIGTLVGEVVPPPAPTEVAPRHRERAAPKLHLDAAALASPVIDAGTWHLGGFVRGGFAPASSHGLFVIASATYLTRTRDDFGVGARSLVAGGGAGWAFVDRRDPVGCDLRAEAIAEHVETSVVDPATSSTDAVGRWRAGFRLGLDASWNATPALGLIAGVELDGFVTSPDVFVGAVRRDPVPMFRWAGLVGLRLRL